MPYPAAGDSDPLDHRRPTSLDRAARLPRRHRSGRSSQRPRAARTLGIGSRRLRAADLGPARIALPPRLAGMGARPGARCAARRFVRSQADQRRVRVRGGRCGPPGSGPDATHHRWMRHGVLRRLHGPIRPRARLLGRGRSRWAHPSRPRAPTRGPDHRPPIWSTPGAHAGPIRVCPCAELPD